MECVDQKWGLRWVILQRLHNMRKQMMWVAAQHESPSLSELESLSQLKGTEGKWMSDDCAKQKDEGGGSIAERPSLAKC